MTIDRWSINSPRWALSTSLFDLLFLHLYIRVLLDFWKTNKIPQNLSPSNPNSIYSNDLTWNQAGARLEGKMGANPTRWSFDRLLLVRNTFALLGIPSCNYQLEDSKWRSSRKGLGDFAWTKIRANHAISVTKSMIVTLLTFGFYRSRASTLLLQ